MEMPRIHASIIFAVAGLGIVLTTLVFGVLTTNQSVNNTGNVKAVGVNVYSDSGCTQQLSLIPWGTLEPGARRNYTIYIKNTGNVGVTLNLTTGNWNSSAARSYITLTWNREAYALSHQTSVSAILSLAVSSSVSGVQGFSFDVIITGTERTQ